MDKKQLDALHFLYDQARKAKISLGRAEEKQNNQQERDNLQKKIDAIELAIDAVWRYRP
jgi:hypothetical protein